MCIRDRYGAVPWASLNVALSAALFAFFRKRATVGAAPGMLMELLFSAPFLWGYLIWLGERGEGHFLAGGAYMDLLLIGCGFVSAIPQLGLSLGIRSVPMISLGIMQYLSLIHISSHPKASARRVCPKWRRW